jgi:hypothetical protein
MGAGQLYKQLRIIILSVNQSSHSTKFSTGEVSLLSHQQILLSGSHFQ